MLFDNLGVGKKKDEWKLYKVHKTYTSIYKSNPGGKTVD